MLSIVQQNLWLIAPSYATVLLLFFGVLLVKRLAVRASGLRLLLRPIDFGTKWFDGRRLIGDHKPLVGWVMPLLAALVSFPFTGSLDLALLLCYAAFFGDLLGSFIKRRLGISEHASLLLLDQLNFLIGAYLAAIFIGKAVPGWHLVFIVIVTFAIHFGSNLIFFWTGLKRERPY